MWLTYDSQFKSCVKGPILLWHPYNKSSSSLLKLKWYLIWSFIKSSMQKRAVGVKEYIYLLRNIAYYYWYNFINKKCNRYGDINFSTTGLFLNVLLDLFLNCLPHSFPCFNTTMNCASYRLYFVELILFDQTSIFGLFLCKIVMKRCLINFTLLYSVLLFPTELWSAFTL